MPVFSIIVVVDLNNVIGLNGDMPWLKLRSDLKYFKEKHPVTGVFLAEKHIMHLVIKCYLAENLLLLPEIKNLWHPIV